MGLIARQNHPAGDAAPRASGAVDASALAAFGADVSLISDDGLPAEAVLAAEMERAATPESRRLLADIFERLHAIYVAGEMIPHPAIVLQLIRRSALACSIELSAQESGGLVAFFDHLNRILFQQQTLAWLIACEMKVRIYGAGWDQNPVFVSMAKGPLENEPMRSIIWRASRINLALGPFGAADDRVLDGINAGAFYLMRFCPADVIERFYPPIGLFCRQNKITTNAELRERGSQGVKRLVTFASRTLGMNILVDWPDFVPHILEVTAGGKCRSAAALWSNYPAISFSSRDQLLARCERFLYDVPARQRVADEMRRELAEASRRVRVTVNRNVLGNEVAA
jgi:hypothetical protein